MSASALLVSEKSFQRAVIDYARRSGWLTSHFTDSRRDIGNGVFVGDKEATGFPDLVLCRGREIVFAELKAEKGRVRPEQTVWLDTLSVAADYPSVRVALWRPSDWPEITSALSRSHVTEIR